MDYYIVLFNGDQIVDILTFDDEDAMNRQAADIASRVPYTDVIGGFRVTGGQTFSQVRM